MANFTHHRPKHPFGIFALRVSFKQPRSSVLKNIRVASFCQLLPAVWLYGYQSKKWDRIGEDCIRVDCCDKKSIASAKNMVWSIPDTGVPNGMAEVLI